MKAQRHAVNLPTATQLVSEGAGSQDQATHFSFYILLLTDLLRGITKNEFFILYRLF